MRLPVRPHLLMLSVATLVIAGCGGTSTSNKQTAGDPYITDAQGRAIKVGMFAEQAFLALGGKAISGANGVQVAYKKGYDYPIRGTGNPDDPNDASTVWWQICIAGGVVVSKQRGTFATLPTY